MPAAAPFTVQRFRGGFALVWTKPDGTRGRKQLHAADRATAESEARKVWAGAANDSAPWTVGRIVQAYLADREADKITSLARRQDAWKAMRPFWQPVDPVMIDKEMCESYIKRRGVAVATVRYELGMLSTALNWAVKPGRRYIDLKPDIYLPTPPDRKERHLSVAQFRRFRAGIRAPHAQLYVAIGIATLARPAAILQMEWDQVNFERGLIDLNPPGRRQTRKRRPVVPMNRTLRKALEVAYAARQTEFVIEEGGTQIKSIKKAFQAASERSGVKATPYTLRHTGAVWAAERGIPMSELAQLMGHDDSRTTEKHYARYSPDYLRGVVDAIDIDILPGEVQIEPATLVVEST